MPTDCVIYVKQGDVYINGVLIASGCDTPAKVSKAVDKWFEDHPIHR